MARKPIGSRAGFDAGQEQTLKHLSNLFHAAKFEVQHSLGLAPDDGLDLVVGRQELLTFRRYAIEIALVREASHLERKYMQLRRAAASKRREDIDEFWLVSNLSLGEMRRGQKLYHPRIKTLTIKELERMLDRINPKPPTPRRSKKTTARTKVGKALETNEAEIRVHIAALLLQIEHRIETIVQEERPNSDEAISERHARLSEFERMKVQVEDIREKVDAFMAGTIKEAAAVKSIVSFSDTIKNWWLKGHEGILNRTYDSALFLSSVGALKLMQADMKTGTIVAGALIGGTRVATGLKGIAKKIFTSS